MRHRHFMQGLAITALALLGGFLGACATAPERSVLEAGSRASPALESAGALGAPSATKHVRFAHQGLAGTAAMYFAADRGYFAGEGIEQEFVPFADNSAIIPALATDQVDAGALASSAALWNAVARGVGLKLVLDMNSNRPGHPTVSLAIRKAIYDAGRGHQIGDLHGLTIASSPPGRPSAPTCALAAALQRAGATLEDVAVESLSAPDMLPALANGAIDGALISEPFLTHATRQGLAVRVMGQDEMYPNFTAGMVGFSSSLYSNRPAALRFARAYIHAGRDYLATLTGRDGQAGRGQVDELIARYTGIEVATIRQIVPPQLSPNGLPSQDSLLYCYQFYRAQGLIPQPVSETALATVWGTDLVEEVLSLIGRVPD
jgi:NitT/TauT family transport system substrate-binding protein